jgi:maltose alpha-D-glucosyltransferase/alpha-amylase
VEWTGKGAGVALRDLWYENTIIYCLDIETFMDSDGDGIGDFRGATRRLDYLWGLGVTCIWLMPFFPSPGRDDGYDVADFCNVDPRLGSLADFVEFIQEADERGMRVIIDLVFNHTSDQHPWFQAARSDPESPYRDYYVWRNDDPGDTSDQVVFPGIQKGIWTFDKQAKAWYLHHFYDFQPDLNMTNPAVREELRKAMGLWIQLGAAGFRIDAAPFIIETEGVERPDSVINPHQYLLEMRDFLQHRKGDAIFLAEVDEGPTVIGEYFGGGNEFHLLFNFLLNRDYFLALAIERADPISGAIRDLPSIPAQGQWVNFARHHDELNLSRLMEREKQEIFKEFGPDENMQIYERGLRRRLAPMLGGDRKRLEMAYSLLFSLPGTPMIFYGEEIGMGENLDLPERFAVRTPMQWSEGPNGGFSDAPNGDIVRPPTSDRAFGYKKVNVTHQRRDPDSLLNWFATLIRARKESPEFGWGSFTELKTDPPNVFAHCSTGDGSGIAVAVHNLSREPCEVTLDLSEWEREQLVDLFGDRQYEPISAKNATMRMEGYGYRWMRVGELR